MSHLGDDIFDAEPGQPAGTRRDARPAREGRDVRDRRGARAAHQEEEREPREPRRRGGCALVAMLAAAVLVIAAVAVSFSSLRSMLPGGGSDDSDFAGPGAGEVEVTVEDGQSGSQIGEHLQQRGVVKSTGAFVSAAAAEPDRAAAIQPGTYALKKQMRAGDAFDLLADPANRIAEGVTIAEGLWRTEIYRALAESTGTPSADYTAAEESSQLKLPKEAEGDVEGWLFPATYEFEKGTSALAQLNTMIEKATSELEKAGVPRERWERTMTVASIVEGEAGAADRAKVARVVENRLADRDGPTVGMLNMDSTVHYIYQERGRAGTTDEMRASDNPYNTYRRVGLPPGPINNPGAAAIEAAAQPDDGPWLFFVTVDPDTGETKFATSQAEHDDNVQEFIAWCDDNRDEDGNC